MFEFLQNHTNVIFQPPFDSKIYTGVNPYTLGFRLYSEIRRVCENPTQEDTKWFPEIAGTDWMSSLKFAMENFKDESFIAQYLTPSLMREMKLFSVYDDDQQEDLIISAIHNENGYQHLREMLSQQYNLSHTEPDIQIVDTDFRGTRTLTLQHIQAGRKPLKDSVNEVVKHLHRLWGFPIKIESVNETGEVTATYECPSHN